MTTTDSTTDRTFEQYAAGLGLTLDHPRIDRARDMWTMERKAEQSYPQVIPPCPSWCRLGEGHEYDSWAPDGDGPYVHTRFHEVYIGRATVNTLESNRAGDVTTGPASVLVTDKLDDITAAQAREVASDLLLAADLLDDIG